MKILTGGLIRKADKYTIENEPIPSLVLMERASEAIASFIAGRYCRDAEFMFFVGKGNNGGDGLAVARLLSGRGYDCVVVTLFPAATASDEYKANLAVLPEDVEVVVFSDDLRVPDRAVIIDALLGVGVEGDVREPVSVAVDFINSRPNEVISIDMPSGMTTEFGNCDRRIVKASLTLTLEFPKLSLLLPEAGDNAGEVVVLPIGLDAGFIEKSDSGYFFVTESDVEPYIGRRRKFMHKGDAGHALLVCGSKGMMGAAILSTAAALRSGCGLVTAHVPDSERGVVHVSNPSAMVSVDAGERFTEVPCDLPRYSAIGVGCGLGGAPETAKAFGELLKRYSRPMVIDADAINILSGDRSLLAHLPANSILTPHIGELRRLVGTWDDDRHKLELVSDFAGKYNVIIVVKGAYTMVCCPSGNSYFNSTGNPGMAKGGSGDVLTGLIAGLLAKGMEPLEAAIAGVYLHGRAGDEAAAEYGEEGMNSSDIAGFL